MQRQNYCAKYSALYMIMSQYTDVELMIGCVHIGWDTDAKEVTLEFSDEEGEELEEVTVTTDYYQLPFDANWLKGINGNEKITATVSSTPAQGYVMLYAVHDARFTAKVLSILVSPHELNSVVYSIDSTVHHTSDMPNIHHILQIDIHVELTYVDHTYYTCAYAIIL